MQVFSRIFLSALALSVISIMQVGVSAQVQPGADLPLQAPESLEVPAQSVLPVVAAEEDVRAKTILNWDFTKDPKEPTSRTAPVPTKATINGNLIETDANGVTTINGTPCPYCRR